MPFLDNNKVTFESPTATGTTTIDSAAYDMSGFRGIAFIVRLGSPAANNNIRARQCDVTAGTYNDLAGTLVNHATNNQHMLVIDSPQKQFIKCRVTRGTTTTIDSIIAIQYGPRTRPVTQPTSIAEQWIGPAEGTA